MLWILLHWLWRLCKFEDWLVEDTVVACGEVVLLD